MIHKVMKKTFFMGYYVSFYSFLFSVSWYFQTVRIYVQKDYSFMNTFKISQIYFFFFLIQAHLPDHIQLYGE